MIKRAVFDSSPLIILFKAGLEEILPKLINEIIVPAPVLREVEAGSPDDPARVNLPALTWWIPGESLGSEVYPGLGAGECSVIAAARRNPESTCVLDDAAARNQASSLGLRVIGTGGLLVLSKKKGYISSFDRAIEAVMSAGLWIDPRTVELLREKAQD